VLFSEPIFLFLFLPVLLALYFAPAGIRYRNALLLAASIVFYAAGGGWFTWVMLGSIVFNWAMALAVERARTPVGAKIALAVAVAGDLALLGLFKYADFVTANADALLAFAGRPQMPLPRILLPIGISFFTFQAMSYVVDVYRRDATAQRNPLRTALYLLLFPQLIAGPIVRYRDIAEEVNRRRVTFGDFADGTRRFVTGLAKKVLVANVVAAPADRIFAMAPAQWTAALTWLALVCYTLQIYFDFSGYSDMAIGLGRMFGFHFLENFQWPYVAQTVQEFWRRWHISLSTWFRDYLYIPLGGSRAGGARTYLNLVLVFTLCGLWHGAAWNFVVWGLFHGMFLVLERLGLSRTLGRLWRPLRHAYALAVVMAGWVFFRADTLGEALAFLRAMAGFGAGAPTPYPAAWFLTPHVVVTLAAGIALSAPLAPWLADWRDRTLADAPRPSVAWMTAAAASVGFAALLAACVLQVAAGTYDPFIYFRF
jgi:alginate O-acetyltransferase complex protein AlgI